MAQLRPEEHQTPYQEERRGRGRDAADVPLIHSFGQKVPVRFGAWADEVRKGVGLGGEWIYAASGSGGRDAQGVNFASHLIVWAVGG